MVKAQQGLVQAQDAKVHDGGGVGHKGDRRAQHLGRQQALDDERQAGDGKTQVGCHRVFHYVAGKGVPGGFFLWHDSRSFPAFFEKKEAKKLLYLWQHRTIPA